MTVHRRFVELVARAGGLPLVADPGVDPEELAVRADAVVIAGGGDVDPANYGATRHPRIEMVDPRRDEFELALVGAALAAGRPVLGVCRGLHVLNVALGGTLHQHLPELTELEHDARAAFDRPVHEVVVDAGSGLAHDCGGARIEVNSLHHQGVDRLGEGMRAVARAPDGTVEGIESVDGRAVGVQWHPELMDRRYEKGQLAIFAGLVERAVGRRAPARAGSGR